MAVAPGTHGYQRCLKTTVRDSAHEKIDFWWTLMVCSGDGGLRYLEDLWLVPGMRKYTIGGHHCTAFPSTHMVFFNINTTTVMDEHLVSQVWRADGVVLLHCVVRAEYKILLFFATGGRPGDWVLIHNLQHLPSYHPIILEFIPSIGSPFPFTHHHIIHIMVLSMSQDSMGSRLCHMQRWWLSWDTEYGSTLQRLKPILWWLDTDRFLESHLVDVVILIRDEAFTLWEGGTIYYAYWRLAKARCIM